MLKGLIRNPVQFFWHGIFWPLIGWIFIVPLTFLIPRKRNCIVFCGRDGGRFCDNAKYLYLHLCTKDIKDVEIFFLTDYPDVYETLLKRGLPTLLYPRLRSVWNLLRAGIVVTDCDAWISKFRFHLLYTSYKVQLWHGVGLKTIGLSNPRVQRMLQHWVMRTYFLLKGKSVCYDLLITTGDAFVAKGYPTGLMKKKTVPTGYPRNDVFFHGFDENENIGIDTDASNRIRAFHESGGKVAAYLPTFRDSGKDAVTCQALDLTRLDQFCRNRNLLMIFKFHSWGMLKNPETREALTSTTNILVYDNTCDIYPVLPMIDIMISDFSSVYMDYLLLDRPILFFTHAIEEYLRDERDFYFAYDELTPGRQCRTQTELEAGLDQCLSGNDEYAQKRAELVKMTFNDIDGNASERIWKHIHKRNG